MAEQEDFRELDANVRELLSLIHIIEVDKLLKKQDKKKIEQALFLAQKVEAELFQLLKD